MKTRVFTVLKRNAIAQRISAILLALTLLTSYCLLSVCHSQHALVGGIVDVFVGLSFRKKKFAASMKHVISKICCACCLLVVLYSLHCRIHCMAACLSLFQFY